MTRAFDRWLPFAGAVLFFLAAAVLFTHKYALSSIMLRPYFDLNPLENRRLFFINFYVCFLIMGAALAGCFFSTSPITRGFALFMALCCTAVASYVLDDILSITLCLYSALLLVAVASFTLRTGLVISITVILIFYGLSSHPAFLGAALGFLLFPRPGFAELCTLGLYLLFVTALTLSVRFLAAKYEERNAMVDHLNTVGARMLLFNHRLQEYVKSQGEEAVKKDRLRFTRDLHDSCGYVFTNIIAVCESAISIESMEAARVRETFHLIGNQAREGLKRTRETLYMIRELEDPISGIMALYQMKHIFEEVTGITVEIEAGNVKHDYGRVVNKVIARVVQEAFTNSIRHGKASRIQIQLWEFPQLLSMTVSDNGRGARQVVKGIGLAGMEERLAALGGSLQAFSPEDGGFRLKVEIPLVDTEGKRRDSDRVIEPDSNRAGGHDSERTLEGFRLAGT